MHGCIELIWNNFKAVSFFLNVCLYIYHRLSLSCSKNLGFKYVIFTYEEQGLVSGCIVLIWYNFKAVSFSLYVFYLFISRRLSLYHKKSIYIVLQYTYSEQACFVLLIRDIPDIKLALYPATVHQALVVGQIPVIRYGRISGIPIFLFENTYHRYF